MTKEQREIASTWKKICERREAEREAQDERRRLRRERGKSEGRPFASHDRRGPGRYGRR